MAVVREVPSSTSSKSNLSSQSSNALSLHSSTPTSISQRLISLLTLSFLNSPLSESTRHRIYYLTELSKDAVKYGWIPLILMLGFWKSEPRPSLVRLFNPLG